MIPLLRIVITLLFILFSFCDAFAQVGDLKRKTTDVFEETESGNLTLRFYNALTGKGIQGAEVVIEEVGRFETDFEGKAIFPPPDEDGVYKVSFRAHGYVPSDFAIEIMAGTIFFNRYSISPVMDIRHMRIVLDWEKEPLDLDAHFVKSGGYHISYRDMKATADGTAKLDRDAMNGYGPETITIEQISSNANYEFVVHNYSHRNIPTSTGLSQSKATVKVFGEGRLMKVFSVPQNQPGNEWRVFTIDNGRIKQKNEIGNTR